MQTSTTQAIPPPVVIRELPCITAAPNGPPSKIAFVSFLHPANDLPFLDLPAYDCGPPEGGIHYGTALAACEILACNKTGYFSAPRNRDDDERVNVDWDSIIPSGKYYYHLDTETLDPRYPICQDFACWKFPHKKLPSAWEHKHPDTNFFWPTDWSEVSDTVKARDAACLASEWTDSLTVAQIVPHTQEHWLLDNGMQAYVLGAKPLHNNSCNLFTLRCDLCHGQFDQGGFIIVPKSGRLVLHFLRPTGKTGDLYHNVPFNHKDSLSFELLYAHFAWELMNIVKNAQLNPQRFNLLRASDETIMEQRAIDAMDYGWWRRWS